MDSNNYVAQRDGQWIVVINGQQIGAFASQSEAEQAFNAAGPGPGQGTQEGEPTGGGDTYETPNGPKTLAQMQQELAAAGYSGAQDADSIHMAYVGVAGQGGGDYNTGLQAMIDAALSGNRERFAEEVRQFNLTFGEGQRQFDRGLYSDLAQSLLGSAVELGSRPEDYFKFNEYTSGGRDIFQQLFGNNPRPDFSSPTGPIEAGNISDLLAKLGITVAPGASGAPGPGGTIQTANGPRTMDQIRAELQAAGYNGPMDDASLIAAYNRTAGDAQQAATPAAPQAAKPVGAAPTAPQGITANAQQRAAQLKAGTPPAALQTASPVGVPLLPRPGEPPPGTPPRAIPPGGAPLPRPGTPPAPPPATPPPVVPPPTPAGQFGPQLAQLSQMNPGAVLPGNINALGPTGLGLLRGALGQSGWDPNEWLYQHMSARPKGQAARRTATSYQAPQGIY